MVKLYTDRRVGVYSEFTFQEIHELSVTRSGKPVRHYPIHSLVHIACSWPERDNKDILWAEPGCRGAVM